MYITKLNQVDGAFDLMYPYLPEKRELNPNVQWDRLAYSINLLRNLSPLKHFYGVWFCGTLACSGGHLCLDRNLNYEGLHKITIDTEFSQICVPAYREQTSYKAFIAFFGIKDADAFRVFVGLSGSLDTPDRNVTPNTVANELEKIMFSYLPMKANKNNLHQVDA